MTAMTNGNWSSATTWSIGRVPQDNDSIIIPAGTTVTVDEVTPPYNHLMITVQGTLHFNGGKKIVMCEGKVEVSTDGILTGENDGCKFEICGTTPWDGGKAGIGPLSLGGFTGNSASGLDLTYFKGTQDNEKVELEWETASQLNCDYFSIETSEDGHTFSPIIAIKAKGNSSVKDQYKYLVPNPSPGVNYYRLKQVDYNGYFKTFRPINVIVRKSTDINIFPNPISAGNTATVELFTKNKNEKVEISAINIEGKQLFSKVFINSGEKSGFKSFQTDAFPKPGTYMVIVSGSDYKTIKKILVQ
jgi:hypothetical protein